MIRFRFSFAVTSILALSGCQAHASQCPAGPEDALKPNASSSAQGAANHHIEPVTPGSVAVPPPNAMMTTPSSDAQSASAGAKSEPDKSDAGKSSGTVEALPELKLKVVGMHIGGGPNDAVTKRPFIEAIEGAFDTMRVCYRDAEDPMKGGSFGVDLRVEREGGHPTLQSVRTVMKGDKMRACLEQAVKAAQFTKPAKGATVLSVSVNFSMSH